MALAKAVNSSAKTGGADNWTTPREKFDELDNGFHFTVDAAADETNHLCDRWFGPGGEHEDATLAPWGSIERPEVIFVNPPHSKNRAFVEKARQEADASHATVVMLIPARTDTRYFHDYIWDQTTQRPRIRTEVFFLKGRLKFGGVPTKSGKEESAPFPSMIVVFRPSVPFLYGEA